MIGQLAFPSVVDLQASLHHKSRVPLLIAALGQRRGNGRELKMSSHVGAMMIFPGLVNLNLPSQQSAPQEEPGCKGSGLHCRREIGRAHV